MNYKNLTNNTDDNESFSGDDEKIRLALGGLKRVEAPKDFDFRLKARIAKSSPAGFKPRFFPVLRYVLPLLLVLIFSTAFVFNNLYFHRAENVPAIAENNFSGELEKENLTIQTAPISETAVANGSELFNNAASAPDLKNTPLSRTEKTVAAPRFVSVKSVKKSKVQPVKNSVEETGGSRLSALSTVRQIITPPGINPDKKIDRQPDFDSGKSLTAKEVLSQLGAEAVFSNEGWKILSVRQNSPAQRSGIKTGDAVEALDGEKLTEKPLSGKKIEGKILTVRRGSDKMEILLIN